MQEHETKARIGESREDLLLRFERREPFPVLEQQERLIRFAGSFSNPELAMADDVYTIKGANRIGDGFKSCGPIQHRVALILKLLTQLIADTSEDHPFEQPRVDR